MLTLGCELLLFDPHGCSTHVTFTAHPPNWFGLLWGFELRSVDFHGEKRGTGTLVWLVEFQGMTVGHGTTRAPLFLFEFQGTFF